MSRLSQADRQRVIDQITAAPDGACIVIKGSDVQIMVGTQFRPLDEANGDAAKAASAKLQDVLKASAARRRDKCKRLEQSGEDFAFPPERLQHGEVDIVSERDPDGWVVPHGKAEDTILRLMRNGFVDEEEAKAGRRFRRDFHAAQLEAKVISSYELTSTGTGYMSDAAAARLAGARRDVHNAMQALGGHNRPAACSVWYIVGCDFKIKEFAERQRFGRGSHLSLNAAQTTLIAALGCLVGHYEEEDSERRRAEQFSRETA